MCVLERKRIRWIDRRDRRILVPGVGEVDQARFFQRAQKRLNLPRVVVGKRGGELGEAKCGEGTREQCRGGTEVRKSWLEHGFPPPRVMFGGDVEEWRRP